MESPFNSTRFNQLVSNGWSPYQKNVSERSAKYPSRAAIKFSLNPKCFPYENFCYISDFGMNDIGGNLIWWIEWIVPIIFFQAPNCPIPKNCSGRLHSPNRDLAITFLQDSIDFASLGAELSVSTHYFECLFFM